jgi:ATP adenylyltransferase
VNQGKVAGAGIPDHVHVHVVPRWDGDTNFMPVLSETKVINQHLTRSWEELSRAFNA